MVKERETTEEEEDLDQYDHDIQVDDFYSSSGSDDSESEKEDTV